MDFIYAILNQIDDALIVSDQDGKVLLYNNSANNLFSNILQIKIAEGEDFYLMLDQIHHVKDGVNDILQNLIHKKQTQKSFSKFVNAQNITTHLEFNYIPLLNENGDIDYVQTIIRDSTENKIFEQKLTALASDISNLIESANAIIIGLDSLGYVTNWNNHCTKVTGYEKNEVYAQRFADKLLDNFEKAAFEKMLSNIMQNNSIDNCEIQIRTKAGKPAIFLLNGTVRRSTGGAIIGITLIGHDASELISYRRSLEIQVEERTKELQVKLTKEKEVVEMKSRFVSIASHEFRTPLSSILHAANYIKSKQNKITSKELDNKIENIEKQVMHMKHLLDDVLTYSKNETAKIQMHSSTIAFTEFIDKIVEEVEQSTGQTHTIKLLREKVPEQIIADEKLLRSILINLLSNAIKFSPNKEHIIFKIIQIENKLEFTIQDFGIGIPENEYGKIFEPFLRGKDVNAIQGTGLGLSIVKKAVALLQGSISFESQPGSGSTFIVTVPL